MEAQPSRDEDSLISLPLSTALRTLGTAPLWLARIAVGLLGGEGIGPWTLVIDGAVLFATIWAQQPLMKHQGARYMIRTEYISMLSFPLSVAALFLGIDAWRLLTQ